MELVIVRDRWQRGEAKAMEAQLLNSHGKLCCLGFYCKALGYSDEELLEIPDPASLQDEIYNHPIPSEGGWLIGFVTEDGSCNSDDCNKLIATNDTHYEVIQEEEREKQIAAIFAENGVHVTFIDSEPTEAVCLAAESTR